ncbi:MAG TPA: hypothetical protein VFU59_00780 [Candidatus Eisenbacteria bacterium]|nr:hypothetical protein [Candidatus Eisenbacteria bacterium]
MWTRRSLLALLLLAGEAATTAAAAGVDSVDEENVPPPAHARGWKSDANAFAFSFFGTALPIAAGAYVGSREGESDLAPVLLPVAAGYVLGPSLGHVYAGNSRRALAGIGFRFATIGAVWIASESDKNDTEEGIATTATITVLAGMLGTISVLADIIDASKSAHRYNAAHGLTRLRLTPAPIGHAMAPGLRADLAF